MMSTNDPMFSVITQEEISEIFEKNETVKLDACGMCLDMAITDWRNACVNGHTYCNPCLQKLVKSDSGARCPGCRGELLKIRSNEFSSNRELNDKHKSLILDCPHDGCDFSGNFSNIKKHLESECPFVTLNCIHRDMGCLATFSRKNAGTHYSDAAIHSNISFAYMKKVMLKLDSVEEKIDRLLHIDDDYVMPRNRNSTDSRLLERIDRMESHVATLDSSIDRMSYILASVRDDLPKKRASPGEGQSRTAVRDRATKKRCTELEVQVASMQAELADSDGRPSTSNDI